MAQEHCLRNLALTLRGPSPQVVVMGCGYVGLPLSMALARTGARVIGLDVSKPLCASLAAAHSHIDDVSDEDLALHLAEGRFRPTTDESCLDAADAILICVPTPLRRSRDPDMSFVVAASETAAQHARSGQLVVLESTSYPGTTEEVLVPLLADHGLTAGQDIAVGYSPERVDPGNKEFGIENTPKIVSGVSTACLNAALALYSRCCSAVVPVSSPGTAEMVKLFENIFRNVNIGLVNELALICRRLGIDVWEVIDAAATKPFGFMSFKPGPGLGGHCLPVDPHYLAWKLRSYNLNSQFIDVAHSVNSLMPAHVLSVITEALNDKEIALRGAAVLILGVTYKRGVSDLRESPALEVIRLLLERGARVCFSDPLVPTLRVGSSQIELVEPTEEILQHADCVAILTDHTEFDYDEILRCARLVVDTRDATKYARRRSPVHCAQVHLI